MRQSFTRATDAGGRPNPTRRVGSSDFTRVSRLRLLVCLQQEDVEPAHDAIRDHSAAFYSVARCLTIEHGLQAVVLPPQRMTGSAMTKPVSQAKQAKAKADAVGETEQVLEAETMRSKADPRDTRKVFKRRTKAEKAAAVIEKKIAQKPVA